VAFGEPSGGVGGSPIDGSGTREALSVAEEGEADHLLTVQDHYQYSIKHIATDVV
jgi:hypothetical protein